MMQITKHMVYAKVAAAMFAARNHQALGGTLEAARWCLERGVPLNLYYRARRGIAAARVRAEMEVSAK